MGIEMGTDGAMLVVGYTLFLDCFVVEADIGIHDFEVGRRQRVSITISIDIDPATLPTSDDIAEAFDYDWIRLEVLALVGRRRFELQETLARCILELVLSREEIIRVRVETSKPDVYPDARAVGCRLEGVRQGTD